MSDTADRNVALAAAGAWADLTGSSFSVVGLGKSGVAAANALARRGADVLAIDDATEGELGASLAALDRSVAVQCGAAGGPAGRRGDLFVVSPGIMPHSARFRAVRALATAMLSEIEVFSRLDRGDVGGVGHPIVAISGTDGKTTTTLWAAHLLRAAGWSAAVGGNIGDPLCGLIGALGPDDIVVAEVSAFQLYTCDRFRPRAAVVTNVARDHTDWFAGDFDAYVATKVKVAARMGPGDTLLINGDDVELAPHRAALAGARHAWLPFSCQGVPERGLGFDGQTLWWSLAAGARVPLGRAVDLGVRGRHPIVGIHNVENALSAAGLALAMGAPVDAVRQGLQTFSLPSHRIEPVGAIGGVRFIDDSKATNPHAAQAGLQASRPSAGEKLVWIGGGSDKEADYSALGRDVGAIASAAILLGQTADRIAAALPPGLPVHRVERLEDAVPLGLRLAAPSGIVLLSPACASFDMFRGYAHRGEVFAQAVAALIHAVAARPSP